MAEGQASEAAVPRPTGRVRRWKRLAAGLVLFATFGLAGLWADGLLFVNAPLEHADAIVVLLGGLPYRAMAAGEIFRAGYAPRVIVSRPASEDPRLSLFRRFGVYRKEDDEIAINILAAYGVPRSAIRVSVTDRLGTHPELRAVAQVLRREGLRSVIVVTDPLHIRRASLYMSLEGGRGLRVIPRVSESSYGSDRWWRNTQKAEALLHEYLGLMAFAYHWLIAALRSGPAT